MSHTGIIVKLTTKSCLVALGPEQKSQVEPEAGPAAGEAAQHTDLILLFLHTTGRWTEGDF